MEIVLIKSYSEKPWRSPETYQLIEDSLREKWSVKSICTKNQDVLYLFLDKQRKEHGKNIYVFNIAEFLDEQNKEGFIPALLDDWKFPHLGSNAKTVAIGLDKAKTKELLIQKGIPTPQYFVANFDDNHIHYSAEKIGYPLFVKPIYEGGHIGINDDSIVLTSEELKSSVKRINDDFGQPAVVERYITGEKMREFSVGIIDGAARLFTPVEIDYQSMNYKNAILSHDTAINDLEKIKLVVDRLLGNQLTELARKTFDAVGASDYSRVDLRMDHKGIYVLEINVMPGLGPHSFLPLAASVLHSLQYRRLIQSLTERSLLRNGIRW